MFDRLLPLLIAELTDLDTFIEVQKLSLAARGVIEGTTSRQPHKPIDPARMKYIDDRIRNALAMTKDVM